MLDGMEDLPGVIVFFDGECLLCNRSVQWLMHHDEVGRLHYAPLQGETAARLLAEGVLDAQHQEARSIVLAERTAEGQWTLWMRSEAVIRVLELAGGAPLRLAILRLVPRVLRDGGYRLVARSRYALFGRIESCVFPDPELRKRVLR